MKIDFGRTADDYSQFRAGFPDAFFERLPAYGVASPGSRVLDLGTGTGTIARGLASRGCEVSALDVSGELLRSARDLDSKSAVMVQYLRGMAERLPVKTEAFELVTAGQCWHWFDRAAAAVETLRVLKPGGHVLIAHFDWIPLPGNVVDATEQLIMKHNPNWDKGGGFGMYPEWLRDLAQAKYEGIETFSFDLDVEYSHEAWRGRVRASAGIAASLSPVDVRWFDDDLKALLKARYPADPLAVFHRVFAVIGRRPV